MAQLRRDAGVTQEAAAALIRIKPNQLSRKERGRAAFTDEQRLVLERFYWEWSDGLRRAGIDPSRYQLLHDPLLAGQGPASTVREPSPGQAQRGTPRVGMGRPYRVRVWLQAFLLELTKAGATEDEVYEAEQLLTAPEVFTYFDGGVPHDFTEDDVLEAMEAIADGVIRRRLRKKGRKL